MTDSLKLKKISTSQEAQSSDLSIRIKAGAWGEEDDHILYLSGIQKNGSSRARTGGA